jgi:pSer/pThr/pTyr-binding forkhead associated (FHA) protein
MLTQLPRAGEEQSPSRSFVLPAPARDAGPYNIGRKEDCDILLLHDKSVSRCHAELCVDLATSSLSIRDLKSKFGVFIGTAKIDDQAHQVGEHPTAHRS